MIDMELYEAEELDSYVGAYQASQTTELPPDLPQLKCRLADILLEISTITRPDAQFLVDLENQIYEIDRKPIETIVQSKHMFSNGEHEGPNERNLLFLQSDRWQNLWKPMAAIIIATLLLFFIAAFSYPI